MRIAAIYDIHANLPALEAVLEDIRHAEVDRVVVGGDVVPGPMPLETISCLVDLNLPVDFIYGNGEVAVLEQMAGRDPVAVPEQYRPTICWTAQQLYPEYESLLAGWPKTLCIQVPGLGYVLFCHATPRNENECFTRLTPEDRLLPVFQGLNVSMVVPGAYWLRLGPDVQLRHTPYDLAQAARRIRDTEYPQAEHFAARNVLQPPSEEETLKAFTQVELK